MPMTAELTKRQLEVAKLAAAGWANPEIAAKLNLSESAVNQHIQTIKRKLGISRKTQIATALHEEGLL